eukprot:8006886-Alexandrium_andersonii.AAC.1
MERPVRTFVRHKLRGKAMTAPCDSRPAVARRAPGAPNGLGGATTAATRHGGALCSRARARRPVQSAA